LGELLDVESAFARKWHDCVSHAHDAVIDLDNHLLALCSLADLGQRIAQILDASESFDANGDIHASFGRQLR